MRAGDQIRGRLLTETTSLYLRTKRPERRLICVPTPPRGLSFSGIDAPPAPRLPDREAFSARHLEDLNRPIEKKRPTQKGCSETAKAPAHENQRLCLVPHTCRFLGQQSLGCRTSGEALLVMRFFTFVPTLRSAKGDAQLDSGSYRLHEGFFAASQFSITLFG